MSQLLRGFGLYMTAVIAGIMCVMIVVFAIQSAQSAQAQCDPADAGTPGDDVITCDVANQPVADVHAEGGNDTIIIDGAINNPGTTVSGDDIGGADGFGNDTIINDGVVNDILGDSATGNGFGSDTITNNGTAADIAGDSFDGDGFSNDVVTNNGTTDGLSGDSIDGNGNGNDQVTNNGTANDVVGDSIFGDGTGDDTITNNGTVNGAIAGDALFGASSGNDNITNNGTVNGDIYGDSFTLGGSGNDTITNNGTVNGDVYGDSEDGIQSGNDMIVNSGSISGNIDAGGGDDNVSLQTGATVGGVIDGGADFDVLEFAFESADEAALDRLADELFAANPNGGTIAFNGISYTWTNFEELVQLLRLRPINGNTGPMQAFCRVSGNIDVYRIVGGAGELAFSVTPQTIAYALANLTTNTPVESSGELTLWALTSGELQLNAPGYDFTFAYESFCGILPAVAGGGGQPVAQGDGAPPLTNIIINRPFDDLDE